MNYNLIQNSKFKIQNSRKAFTLIELLVAIAIVGILAAVVLVSMSSYRKKATASAALQTASSVMPAAMQCALKSKKIGDDSGQINVDDPLCEGSSFTWPPLGGGWYWWFGNVSNYALCDKPASSCSGDATIILCPIDNSEGWSGSYGSDVQSGTCTIHKL